MREGKWLFTGGKVVGHPTENFHPSMCTWRPTRRGIFHFPNHPRGKQYRFFSTIQYNKIHRNNNSTAEATTATAPNPSFMAFPFLPWMGGWAWQFPFSSVVCVTPAISNRRRSEESFIVFAIFRKVCCGGVEGAVQSPTPRILLVLIPRSWLHYKR